MTCQMVASNSPPFEAKQHRARVVGHFLNRHGFQDITKPRDNRLYSRVQMDPLATNLSFLRPKTGATWRTVPFSRWLVAMVIVSPLGIGLWDHFHPWLFYAL